ncbi:hypothetical protein ABH935_009255 [Catenulispora sp. GAS73]|uniref:WXG100-like domain-containing protein n=1 Tax=Catenulispora sp. GAS73 TaxID=3156269 RepID=UPI00351990A3
MSESDHALAEILEYISELEADIPGVRSWVGGILIGKIPLTDEVTVYELADLWGDVQNLLVAASTDAQNLMGPVLESWTGDAAAKFGLWWEGYLNGLNGLVDNAAQTQQGVQDFGLQIETMKFMAVLGLIMMLITIFQLIALAWGTLGISAVGIWPTIKATGVAIAQVAKNVLASIAKITWKAIGEFIWDLIRLSPRQIVARSMADALLAQAGEFLPDEVLTVLKEMAPEGVGDVMAPAMAQVRNELRDALVQAQLRAWTDAGTSLATTAGDDVLGQWAGRQIGEQTFAKAMWLYLRPRILNGIAFMGGGNLLAQLFEVAGGERTDLNLGELTMSTAQGAVFGAAMWGSPAGHVLGSTAASAAFALVDDALKGGVDDKGKPVDWWGDVLSGARSGFEAGVVFGIHSALPEMNLGADPVMPEGGRVTGFGELDGVLTINVERDGVQVMARPDYVTVSDANSGAKLVVRNDGTFDKQGEFSGSTPEPTAEPVVESVVEADPPGTTYQRPAAAEPVLQETETPVETPAGAPAEAPSSEPGTQAKPVVVEADAQPKQVVVEADTQAEPAHFDPTKLTSQARVPVIESRTDPPHIVNQAEPPRSEHQAETAPIGNEAEIPASGHGPLKITLDPETVAHLETVLGSFDPQAISELDIKSEGPMISFGPKSGANRWHIVIHTEPNQPARILETGAGLADLWLGLPTDFGQTGPHPDRAIPDPTLVAVTRTDVNGAANRVYLNAEEKIPEEFQGNQDAIFVINNRGYKIRIGLLGEALRDGGVLVVESRTAEGKSGANPDYKEFFQAMLREQANPGSELPPGYRLVDISHWPTHPVSAGKGKILPAEITRGPRPEEVLGDGFHTADAKDPRALGWPNSRIVIERVDQGRSPIQAVFTLLEHGYSADLVGEIGTKYGDQSLAAAATMVEHGVPQDKVLSIIARAANADVALREYVKTGIAEGTLGPVHVDVDRQSFTNLVRRAFDSGTIVNLRPQRVEGLARDFAANSDEVAKVQDLGHHAELRRAVEFAEQGKAVGIAGVDSSPYDINGVRAKLTPGKADVTVYETHTSGEAIQRKTPPTHDPESLLKHLKEGITQIRGEKKEIPPEKFRRVVDLEVQNPKNPFYSVDREGFLHTMGQYPDIEISSELLTKNGEPITIRVFNGHGTFEFGPADLGPRPAHAGGDVFARIVDVETALIAAPAPGDIDPHLVDQLRDTVDAVLTANHDLTPEQVGRLQSLKLDLEAVKGEFTNDLGQKLRPLDGLERNLLSGTMVKIAHTLAGGVPEAADVSSSPHQITSITPDTEKFVNQFQGFEHDHAAEAQAFFDAEKSRIEDAAAAEVRRIENRAAAEVAHAEQTMHEVLQQAENNLPAMKAARDQSDAELRQLRLRMFGEAVPPEPKVLAAELQGQRTALSRLDAQHAASLRFSATLKEAGDALTFMEQLAHAYQARMESARQYVEQYDAEAGVTPSRGLFQDSETRWRQVLLDHLADQATRAVQDARELHALVEEALNQHQGGTPDRRLAGLFADFTQSSHRDQAVAAVQDALLVHQHFTDNGLTPLLEDSDRLIDAWTEQRDALAHSVRGLRAQLIDLDSRRDLAGRQRRITQVGTSLEQATEALRGKESALRERWLKDPGSLPTRKAVLESQISDLRVALPEAWRRGDQAAVWSISDDLNRAQAHIAWIDQQPAHTPTIGPAGDPTAARQALSAAAAPAFQQRYSGLTAEALRTHLDDQLSAHGLQQTWHIWEQRRREGYVTGITDLTEAQAKLHALQNDHATPPSDVRAQQAVVNDLAARHAAWHIGQPGDVPEHQVGAGFRDVAVPGQVEDLTALGNPKDWPVTVSVEKLETPSATYYHAHRNVLKDFFTAKTAAPDVIGGRLPIELTQETGHWKVQLNDGTVLDVRAHKPVSLVIDSGPAWRGGLSMLRLDGGLGAVGLPGHLPPLVGKVGPIAVIGSLSGRLGNVDLQYNPVLRRDFYTYEHIGAQTIDIKVLSDPGHRFPKKWQIQTPSQGTVLAGVERTLQFYTKWGVQAIAVPMLQFAWGDPAHGLDSLVPFLQVGGVGVVQITGEAVKVRDAATLRPLRTELSVGAEWLVGDFISLPSHIGGIRLHPDVSRLAGWDPGPGTVMTNHVKGIDLTPFVKHHGAAILARTPWLGETIQRRAIARQQAEDARLAAVAQHDNEVRRHLEMLKYGSGEHR